MGSFQSNLMVTGHKDKKGDFHPHTSSSGGVSENDVKISVKGNNDVIKVQPKPNSGMNRNREKEPKLGTDFHLYRIWQFESDDGGGDRQEVAHVKAKNMEDAIKFVKDYYFKKQYRNELNVDNSGEIAVIDYSTAYDGNGKEMKKVPDGMEDEVNWRTQGFQVEEDDSQEENFNTIYGGNDFFDVTSGKIKTKGKTTADRIKEHGDAGKAFYSHAGKGFESGNAENSYNLNNPHPVISQD